MNRLGSSGRHRRPLLRARDALLSRVGAEAGAAASAQAVATPGPPPLEPPATPEHGVARPEYRELLKPRWSEFDRPLPFAL